MKNLVSILLFTMIVNSLGAQSVRRDSLLSLIEAETIDTAKVNHLLALGSWYRNKTQQDSALVYAYQGLELSQAIGYKAGEMNGYLLLAGISYSLGDYASGIRYGYTVYYHAKSVHDTSLWLRAQPALTNSLRDQGDSREALKLMKDVLPIIISTDNCSECGVFYAAIGSNYFGLEQYDSALYFIEKGLSFPPDFSYGWRLMMAGKTMVKLKDEEMAFQYLRKSIHELSKKENNKDLTGACASLSMLFASIGQTDSAIYYGRKAITIGQYSYNKELAEAYLALSQAYEKTEQAEALKYYKLATEVRNNIYNQDKQKQITSFKFNEIIRQNEMKAAQLDADNSIKLNALLGSTFTFVVIAFLLFRNSRNKQRAKERIEEAFDQLKSTQAQLIQSEKMASLGELTAGIAHEIQNPLNFVNNFSEINDELTSELVDELNSGNTNEAKIIAQHIQDNSQKIMHHGKRAGSIVKGMLEHSRKSEGEKSPTDLNVLADEYLRLALHGMRAKDKSFDVKLVTEFDPQLPKINVVQADIARVVLNLINNAFYAVHEKAKQNIAGYEPMVKIKTSAIPSSGGGGACISVEDNGKGIPDAIKDKIFQPFFTTKPTGQGTGLGLSLSYDIVKAHGGEITVNTNENDGTEFTIILPV